MVRGGVEGRGEGCGLKAYLVEDASETPHVALAAQLHALHLASSDGVLRPTARVEDGLGRHVVHRADLQVRKRCV